MNYLEMGKAAFNKGIKCAPCLDKGFQDHFFGNSSKVDSKEYCKACTEWARGWHLENLASPVIFS